MSRHRPTLTALETIASEAVAEFRLGFAQSLTASGRVPRRSLAGLERGPSLSGLSALDQLASEFPQTLLSPSENSARDDPSLTAGEIMSREREGVES